MSGRRPSRRKPSGQERIIRFGITATFPQAQVDFDILEVARYRLVHGVKAEYFANGIDRFDRFQVGQTPDNEAIDCRMAVRGVVPRALVFGAPLFVLHLGWSLQALRGGLAFEGIRRLRRRYRQLYAVIGLLILAATFAG